MLFNLRKILVNLITLNIRKTRKKDNLDDTFLILESFPGDDISKIAKVIIKVSKYVKASE